MKYQFQQLLKIENQIQLQIKVLELINFCIIELQTNYSFATCGGKRKVFRRFLETSDCALTLTNKFY